GAGGAPLPNPVCLHADHLNYLTGAGHECSQSLAVGIGDRTWLRTNAFSEQRNDLSIERVGFGEPSGGAGEIPDMARIDHGEWQASASQSRRHGDFKSSRGFEHNQSRGQVPQVPLEPVDGASCFFTGSIAPRGCGLPSTDSLSGF